MTFALYEADDEDATFIRVAVAETYQAIETIERERIRKRREREQGLLAERRIVPGESEADVPLHASLDELMALVNERNDMYPAA